MTNPDRLRLALVRQRHAGFGGAERMVTSALARLRSEEGVDVTIIARTWPRDALGGARLIRCNPLHIGRTMRDVGFARSASRLCTGFDLVQAHERVPGAQIFRAGSGVHAEWLHQLAKQRGQRDASPLASERYHRAVLALETEMLSHPAMRAIIANSDMVAADLARHHPACAPMIRVIWNGIDLDRFCPSARLERRSEARRSMKLDTSHRAVALLGSDWQRKGAACLIAALARLPERVVLVLAGKESRPARFRDQASQLGVADRIRWIGATDDAIGVLAAADCLALPSIYDQCPSSSIEALACGLPVVLSSQCGTRALVSEGCTGFTVDAHEHDAWPEALANALDLPPSAAEAARESVRHLSLERMVESWLALYRALMAGRQR